VKGRDPGSAAVSERLQKAVAHTIQAGYQLDGEAFVLLETLSKTEDPIVLMEKLTTKIGEAEQKPLFITRNIIEEYLTQTADGETAKPEPLPSYASPASPLESGKENFRPYAKEIDADIKILEDPASLVTTVGSMEEYHEYFLDRFRRLQRCLRQRIDAKDAMSIVEARKATLNAKVKIIGMLTERRESKQRTFLRLEDTESTATVMVYPDLEASVNRRVQDLLLDQVVCISAIKSRNDLFILEDVLFPEVPQRAPNKASEPVYAALISDLHVGSKLFMRAEFNRFLLWLNGKLGNTNWREIAGRVKYIVLAGDIVDGIGVYPRQTKELTIRDIYRQYAAASRYLEQIPDYVKLIIIPGNHDASRKALPQPALPKDFAEPVYEVREVQSLGNPSSLSLHGVELLVYHGRSLDDVIANTPGVSFGKPQKAMEVLLRARHLAPIYGQRTPIAPSKRDYLVIERVPDIFHTGHVHVVGHDRYRGVLLVNSGAWQEQTEYMSKLGLKPDPGVVPVVNLQTLQVTTLNFRES
jgi:DNA polymerase II small subunit